MITQIILLFIFILGTVSAAVIVERKFEEIVPLIFLGIVFIIFLTGMIGNLIAGFYLVLIITSTAFGVAVMLCCRKKRKFLIKQHMITPAFIIFVIIYMLLIPFNAGRVSHNWDEFSCWNSVVKIMTIWDQFGTVKEAKLLAAIYPPGMACFQYFIEKLHMVVNHTEFSEWRLFFGYQLFTYALLFPFLRNLKHNNIWKSTLCGSILFVAPSFFTHFFLYLTIDTFLGTLFGVGLAAAFFWPETDIYYKVYISSVCSMLVLAKSAGTFLAIIVALSFLSRIYFAEKNSIRTGSFVKLKGIGLISGSILIPYILWNIHVGNSGCFVILTTPIDYRGFIQILLGNGEPEKIEILKAFISNLGRPVFGLVNYGAGITLLCAVLIIGSLFYITGNRLFEIYKNKNSDISYVKIHIVLFIFLTGFILYIFGMMLMYLYKIPDASLPSFTRYMDIYLHGIVICSILGLLLVLQEGVRGEKTEIILSLFVFLLFPQEPFTEFLTYSEQSYGLERRAKYTDFIERCKDFGGVNRRIFSFWFRREMRILTGIFIIRCCRLLSIITRTFRERAGGYHLIMAV